MQDPAKPLVLYTEHNVTESWIHPALAETPQQKDPRNQLEQLSFPQTPISFCKISHLRGSDGPTRHRAGRSQRS